MSSRDLPNAFAKLCALSHFASVDHELLREFAKCFTALSVDGLGVDHDAHVNICFCDGWDCLMEGGERVAVWISLMTALNAVLYSVSIELCSQINIMHKVGEGPTGLVFSFVTKNADDIGYFLDYAADVNIGKIRFHVDAQFTHLDYKMAVMRFFDRIKYVRHVNHLDIVDCDLCEFAGLLSCVRADVITFGHTCNMNFMHSVTAGIRTNNYVRELIYHVRCDSVLFELFIYVLDVNTSLVNIRYLQQRYGEVPSSHWAAHGASREVLSDHDIIRWATVQLRLSDNVRRLKE